MRGRYVALTVIALAIGGASGVWLERQRTENAKNDKDSGPKVLYWVAPMDPNFRKDGPGKSPMGMDLVPVYEGDEPKGDPGNTLSRDELADKFRRLLAFSGAATGAEAEILIQRAWGLRQAPSVTPLI